ncbi:hypothetical protein PMI36_02569 [Pseudomonas sp. GM79]|uniref:hypothetical protein n=1 Tax=Pseudomonas sp. GM79 TaxID=1144338 RepID=UPI00026F61AF|nr:hypothetical protein [Pseudomonas sp. GM79]EJN23812.1 hypothetical protein PMI36_02569 [Pseudomonas sp. GM79]
MTTGDMDIPEIPGDFPGILEEASRIVLIIRLDDFKKSGDGNILKNWEQSWTDELKTAQPGHEFFGMKVVHVDNTADTATLQLRLTDYPVPHMPGLKIGEASVDLVVARWVNLTTDTKPPIQVLKVDGFSLDIELSKTKNQTIRLGYAQDDNVANQSRIVLVSIKWDAPKFSLFGLLGKTNQGGLLIDVQGESPVAIPLGATGVGLKGIGLLYGEHFAPALDGAVAGNAMEHLAKADAGSYADWAENPKDLHTWLAVPEDIRVYGISALLVDMASGGKLVQMKQYGLANVSYGPTIIFRGETWVLDNFDAGETVGVIDLRSQSIFGRATQRFEIPWIGDALKLQGSLEISASLLNQKRTYVAIGGYDMYGCSVKVLDILKLAGGVRIVPSQGIAVRATGPIRAELRVSGFNGGYQLWFDIEGGVGWSPITLEAKLTIGGSLWLEALGHRLGLGAWLITELYLKKPFIFKMGVDFVISYWFATIHILVDIWNFEEMEPAIPVPTLKSAIDGPLAIMHPPSGYVGQLDPAAPKVWPDTMFVLDFLRRAGESDIVVNPADSHVVDAGIDVYHRFTTLMIERKNPSGDFSEETNVRASWLLNAVDGATVPSSRLAIPCNDPLGWLQRFDYAQPSTSRRQETFRLQTFGMGPTRPYLAQPGGQAIARFEDVTVSATATFWLVPVPWADGYQRALNLRQFAVEFSTPLADGSGRALLAVEKCELRFLSPLDRAPYVGIRNGTDQAPTLLRPVSNDQGEWSITIERTAPEAQLPLLVNSEWPNLISAIGYCASENIATHIPATQVLAPGHYRLSVAGVSKASFRGHDARDQSPWAVVREFDVVPPPLRPYLRYATFGDERIFGLDVGGWNPNPAGHGFGHYPDHFRQVRASVGYLHMIYPDLFVRTDDDASIEKVHVDSCKQGTPAGSKTSGEWRVETGQPSVFEDELTLQIRPDQLKGIHDIKIKRSQDADANDVVDQWTYRVSGYRSPSAHLSTASSLVRAIGPFGSRRLPATTAPYPAGLDVDAVRPAQIGVGWTLPKSIASLVGVESSQAGLSFLRLLEWCRVFTGTCYPLAEGPFARPTPSDLCLLMDQATAPVALLIRTSEPCDWRRIEVTAVTAYTGGTAARRFALKILPSPDGCQCALLFLAEGVPVRIPKGELLLRIRFRLECDPLPRLTLAADFKKTFEEVVTVLDQQVGKIWWEK